MCLHFKLISINNFNENEQCFYYCISPNVGRYFGLVTGPPPPPAMEAMEAAAMERFRRLLSCQTQSVLQDLFFGRNVCVFIFLFFCYNFFKFQLAL